MTKQKRAPIRKPPGLDITDDFFVQLYTSHGRPFPWRDENVSPFGILVAEILLKQTQAGKVAKVWPSLVSRYRDADELAAANADELFDMIAVLGFGNQRTKALIDLASSITGAGGLPSRPEDLIKFPFVGIYTAHAVACFAFGLRVPVVDLSVVRVVSRLAGIKAPTDIRRAKSIWSIAWSLLPLDCFREHNYGMLDFTALICKPRTPRCDECPLAGECAYVRHWATRDGDRRLS